MEQRRKEIVKNLPAFRFWENWDEDERNSAVHIAGLCVAAFGLFMLIAMFSYLLHWKQDLSLLSNPDMMNIAEKVANCAGKTGAKLGKLFVCDLFGLGSFAMTLILFAVAARLTIGRWHTSMIKTVSLTVSGTALASLALAYIGDLFGLESTFGGGLGGRVGAAVCSWICNFIGRIPTLLVLVILALAWLFFCSKRFTAWFASLGKRKNREDKPSRRGTVEAHTKETRTEPKESDTKTEEAQTEPEESEDTNTEPSEVQSVPAEVYTRGTEVSTAAAGAAAISTDIAVRQAAEARSGTQIPASPEEQTAQQEGGPQIEVQVANNLNTEIKELPPIDNRLDAQFGGLSKYQMPSIDLLDGHNSGRTEVSTEELQRNNNKIRSTLKNYRIEVNDVKAIMGPTVTLYKVYPAPGVQVAQIKRLQEDIGISLNAKGVRVVTLNDSVGIEVANDKPAIVPLKSMLNDNSYRESKAELPVAIGYTITQEVKVFDLADAPHLLIAGATKQGKSVCLNVIINSLLYSKHPSELKFVFIDPKMVEFSAYSSLIHHYLAVMPNAVDDQDERKNAIIKKAKDAEVILRSLCIEMDNRYELIAKAGVSNIKDYNRKFKNRKLNPNNGHNFMPYLVTVVDEYADLTMTTGASPEVRASSKSITNSIIRLAQKGRAAGIHVILATQRPSVDVISGLIKTNFPMRIAFRVSSRTDSMTILDNPGAEKLIGKGDMLFSAGIEIERVQCAYISTDEIARVNRTIEEQIGLGLSYSTPYYLPETDENAEGSEGGSPSGGELGSVDSRFEEAARLVVTSQRGSTTDLQRKLGMGYARAGRVMDQLERAGIVGPPDGSKMRSVLVGDLDTLQEILNSIGS